MSISDRERLYCEFLGELGFADSDDFSLFEKAMRHTSYVHEMDIPLECSYERLEFLGDAVLKLTISKYLYLKYPNYKEGILSKIRGEIVADKTLAQFATKIGLNNFILMSKNERKMGGEKKQSILACAFEAFLGAIYLTCKDCGYTKVEDFIISNFSCDLCEIEENLEKINPKQQLQEYTQEKNHTLPQYTLISKTGSEHNSTFEVTVSFEDKILGRGFGKSKKSAQQDAAKNALEYLKREGQWNQ